jgi:hypothetical protein
MDPLVKTAPGATDLNQVFESWTIWLPSTENVCDTLLIFLNSLQWLFEPNVHWLYGCQTAAWIDTTWLWLVIVAGLKRSWNFSFCERTHGNHQYASSWYTTQEILHFALQIYHTMMVMIECMSSRWLTPPSHSESQKKLQHGRGALLCPEIFILVRQYDLPTCRKE